MTYEVVEKNPETGQFETRLITKKGPTGLITTGVRPVDRQMATRVLRVTLSDSPDQTRAIMRSQAAAASHEMVAVSQQELEPFRDFQLWLAANKADVIIPFARVLDDLVPAAAVRMRRDFKQLLTVIKTLALMAQKHRARRDGAIVADFDDYAGARDLLKSLFDSIVADDITPQIRETVQAVPDEPGTEVSVRNLARQLGLAKSTIDDRVRKAIRGGWLVNLELRRGCPARLIRGAALPDIQAALPEVEKVREASGHPPKADTSPDTTKVPVVVGRNGQLSGCPDRPAGTGEQPTEREKKIPGKVVRGTI